MVIQPRLFLLPFLAFAILTASLAADDAHAIAGRLGIHAVRAEPHGDADDLSQASWGGGFEGVLAFPNVWQPLAFGAGFEFINFDSQTLRSKPDEFSFERTITTSQNFARFYAGLQLGAHGHGFLQPFAGLHGSIANHSYSSTLAERYDNPENDRSQTTSENDVGLGYDLTGGLHFNVRNRFGAYVGVRYLRLFGLNQKLGDESRPIDPEYIQMFFGFSMDLGYVQDLSEE